jgi:hypothetical protein
MAYHPEGVGVIGWRWRSHTKFLFVKTDRKKKIISLLLFCKKVLQERKHYCNITFGTNVPMLDGEEGNLNGKRAIHS